MNSNNKSSGGRQARKGNTPQKKNSFRKDFKKPRTTPQKVDVGGIRLNKFISNSGICSRREADTYIEHGSVTVNGKLVTEMGYKVQKTDEVRFDGTSITPEKKKYVLLNKPKNYITTMDDERGRKTVMELVSNAANERIYPVGRLDRMTTGLLLFTNDGELAKKLTHPKHDVKKLYHASLDRKFDLKDLQKLPKNASPVRMHNRCKLTGRPRGYMRTFGISRVTFREMANNGLIPGVRKASW
jgi:23S rRNA pseudouridine2605 synthase